ncbi:beta-secretase 1-like [Galleria mellonella]|uniref:Beta-secretase 1-like n=1 Tax=Galleria mellonella TaxID=7137 RepID=A0A6J3C6I5_GALME|nr:beta-secretase 1-like [Galleria mellonella]
MLYISILFSFLLNAVCGEDYNLHGDAGQAYAIEVYLGHPSQKLNVLVDTGSTTLAIATYPRQDNDEYFHFANSTSINDSGKEIQAKYSQGMWLGRLASDFIRFPSLSNLPEVRTDMALITKSHKFFMNGSGWQGLLGLAYLPVGAWGDHLVVESWLDSLDRTLKIPTSFELKLCGAKSPTNATHYGNFRVIDNADETHQSIFRTPILRKRWYEVGVLSIRVLFQKQLNTVDEVGLTKNSQDNDASRDLDIEMCQQLNEEKSIVDSGTTNIRLPDDLFRQVVDKLKNAVLASNILILDEFWYHAEAACWTEPQNWSLPWLAIDLLSEESDHEYFTLELPPQNYMRVVSARNSSSENGTVPEFCYKLGLEAGGKETVLGYTAMEGLQVLFNRSAGWIGWETSNCGPNARITGPYNVTASIRSTCQLIKVVSDGAVSIKAAQWTLCVISIIAAAVLIYLLAPCIKMMLMKPLPSSNQISLSQAALVEPASA